MRCYGITKQLKRCQRDAAGRWPFCAAHRRQFAYVALTIAGGVLASYLATFLPIWRNNLQEATEIAQPSQPASPVKSNVGLVVGRPGSPVFWLYNESDVPAERPKYGFVIYDLDQADVDQPSRILHIPFKLFEDYILPRRALGPWKILDLSVRAREVPVGHHVFGYVTVQCFNCVALRTYWLEFKNGESDWYREMSTEEASVVNRTLANIVYSREKANEMVEKLIPKDNRIALQ